MRTSLISLAVLAATVSASYLLEDDYASDAFADMFDFFTDNDPTNGYVNYVSYDQATSAGLYKTDNGAVYMGVDATNVASGRGRDSVRLSTKKTYNHGLIILDLAHMPGGACGTWPAFWMLGSDWPVNGEIDIIEGVHGQSVNTMAMHTNAGCSITSTGAFSGSLQTDDCDVNAPDQATNAGCAIKSQDTSTYGSGFNANGGGVYATEWTSDAISIWFFPRDGIPSDISSGNPDPSNWGLPQGHFAGNCDIDEHVKDQKLVFDVTFCGDWAGSVWSTDSTCSTQASTCQGFVQNNPSAFQDTYWLINSLKVYSDNGAAPTHTTITTFVTASQTAVPTVTTETTFVTLTSSTESTATESTITFTFTYPGSNPTFAPTETYLPPTFVTVTEPCTTLSATESAALTTAPAETPTWPSSSGPLSTDSWDNGASWGTGSWQGNNNNNGNGNGNNDGNNGGWGGRASGGWRWRWRW